MAPQQNSTLIDEKLVMSPSLIDMPDDINRYSPILPPKNHQNNHNVKKNNNNNQTEQKKIKKAMQTICNDHRAIKTQKQQQQQQENRQSSYKTKAENKRQKNVDTAVAAVGRSRSISLYGVNSTEQQGSKEITIWLADDEPRYISGATNKTTCNDIIKALIDDEIQNGNYVYCKRTTIKVDGNSGVVGVGNGNGNGTASRDYTDYVLTECWRGIERSYDGRMPILPVWKAWSRVHNELRLSLKHRQDINEPPNLRVIQKRSGFQSICKYIGKIFSFGKKSKQCAKNTERATERFLLSQKERIPDEFLFIILPENFQCPRHSKHTRPHPHPSVVKEHTKQPKPKFLTEKLYRLSEGKASKRKRHNGTKANNSNSDRRSKGKSDDKDKRLRSSNSSSSNSTNSSRDLNTDNGSQVDEQNCIKRRKDTSRQSNIRSTLAQKTAEMNRLYEREYALTKELTNKCQLFKLQNELYTHADKQFELSVGQIQGNVEAYAKEIIKTEQELLELKKEIKQDITLINNLKRMTLMANINDCGIPQQSQTSRENIDKIAQIVKNSTDLQQQQPQKEMQFVDNIYEFCDNNASMLV